ncbi:MAG TPA: hypothetical protein VGA09_02720, partial [Candidatus Binatia bacterium]
CFLQAVLAALFKSNMSEFEFDSDIPLRWSALGHKRTWLSHRKISANTPKRTSGQIAARRPVPKW